jgi:uncharacterized phage protein gp47/JayE
MAECLATAPPDIDLRQGSIFFDAVASACYKIAEYYADLSTMFFLTNLATAVGEYLDDKGAEHNVFRNPATAARYEYVWTGTTEPAIGERFFTNGLYFTLREGIIDEVRTLYLEAESLGFVSNNILPGTPAVPMGLTTGLITSTFGTLIEVGADIENDDEFRERIREKVAGPAENGNRQHYKTWAEEIPGCTRARVIPLFAGPNTVMVVCIGPDGLPAPESIVKRVQEHIDPMTLGKTVVYEDEDFPVGDGLGDGRANIGAHLATIAPARIDINISFDVELRQGATVARIKTEAEERFIELFKELSLTTPERQNAIIRVSAISAILYSLSGLIDYSNLRLNDGSANIELTVKQVAALGEVTANAIV